MLHWTTTDEQLLQRLNEKREAILRAQTIAELRKLADKLESGNHFDAEAQVEFLHDDFSNVIGRRLTITLNDKQHCTEGMT